ncbi:MAG TPA: DUF5678 domain-containing protein [Anaerolineae bacterium]|nr:DUF5678 domain-containing protein [Anaerolineae bacterium]
MTAVNLRPKLAEQLRPEAERRQKSIEELVNDWLEDDLWEQRNKKIHEEAERYYARHAQLRAQYADKVIAMRDGEVVDSGDELLEVYQRVRERFGDEPVLITRVGVEPVETYTIRSPRLGTPIP